MGTMGLMCPMLGWGVAQPVSQPTANRQTANCKLQTANPFMSYRRETLPDWAKDMVALYESDAASQFILHGNIHDRFLLGTTDGTSSGGLMDFLKEVLMPQFDVLLLYVLGNGLRVDRGGEKFKEWPPMQMNAELPRQPRPAVELFTRVLRYCANLARTDRGYVAVGDMGG